MKLTNIFKTTILVALLAVMSACSFVTVPPAHQGKVLSPAGYQPEVLQPGKYTLWWRQELVLLDTSTDTYKEEVSVILADRLQLDVEVRFRGRILGSQNVINAMFNDIQVDTKERRVSFRDAYRIYGQMVVRNKVREVLSQYNVDEVHKNYMRLSVEVGQAIEKQLAGSPIEVGTVSFGNIKYPDVVTNAISIAEERRLQIAQEQAQQEIELLKRENERLLAEAEYQTRIIRANAVRDENKIIGEGVTAELLELKRMEYMTILAEKAGEGTVYIPVEFGQSTGASVKMFK